MHEQSETVERDGRYYNVYGRDVPGKAGQPLPRLHPWEQASYATEQEAVQAAQKRSEMTPPEDELAHTFTQPGFETPAGQPDPTTLEPGFVGGGPASGIRGAPLEAQPPFNLDDLTTAPPDYWRELDTAYATDQINSEDYYLQRRQYQHDLENPMLEQLRAMRTPAGPDERQPAPPPEPLGVRSFAPAKIRPDAAMVQRDVQGTPEVFMGVRQQAGLPRTVQGPDERGTGQPNISEPVPGILGKLGVTREDADIVRGALRGPAKAIDASGSAAAALAQYLTGLDIEHIRQADVTSAFEKATGIGAGEPTTTAGGLAQGLTQWLAIAGPVGRAIHGALLAGEAVAGAEGTAAGLKAMGNKLLHWALTTEGADIVADFFAFQPNDPRASNIFKEFFPGMENMVTEYLAATGNDSELEGRLKNVLEGRLMNAGMATATVALLKTLKLGRQLTTAAADKMHQVDLGFVLDEAGRIVSYAIPPQPEIMRNEMGHFPGPVTKTGKLRKITAPPTSSLGPDLTYAEMGKGSASWYHGVGNYVKRTMGKKDGNLFLDMMAIASQGQLAGTADLNIAIDAFNRFKAGEAPEALVNELKIGNRTSKNIRMHLERLLRGEKLENIIGENALKVKDYRRALDGDKRVVVVDRWMWRAYFPEEWDAAKAKFEAEQDIAHPLAVKEWEEAKARGEKVPSKPPKREAFNSWQGTNAQYYGIQRRVTEEADRLGIHPSDLQAQIWAGIKLATEGPGATGLEPMRTMIKRRIDAGEIKTLPGQSKEALINSESVTRLAGVVAALAAGKYAGDSDEEQATYALLAAGLTPGGAKKMSKVVANLVPAASALRNAKAAMEGHPIRAYHGTPSPFPEFDITKASEHGRVGPAIYFSESPAHASSYAEKGISTTPEFAPNVRPAHLDVRQPFDLDAPVTPESVGAIQDAVRSSGRLTGNMEEQVSEWARDTLAAQPTAEHPITNGDAYEFLAWATGGNRREVNQILQDAGYDGITHQTIHKGEDTRVWAVFDPSQVHSPFEVSRMEAAMAPAIAGGGPSYTVDHAWRDTVDEKGRAIQQGVWKVIRDDGEVVDQFYNKKDADAAARKLMTEAGPARPISGGGPAGLTPDDPATLAQKYADAVITARRGGPRTHELVQQEAQDLIDQGLVSMDSVRALTPGTTLDDAHAVATVKVLAESGLKIQALAKQALATGDPADIKAALQQLYLHGEIDPKRIGVLTEAGRTVSALNDPTSGLNRFLLQFEELLRDPNAQLDPMTVLRSIAQFQSPEQLAVLAKQTNKPGFWKMFNEYYVNSLLWGPKSWMANFLGNSGATLWAIPERGLAARMPGAAGGVEKGEAVAMFEALFTGMGKAWELASQAFREGESQFEKVYGTGTVQHGDKLEGGQKAISADTFNLVGPAGQAVDAIGNLIRFPMRVLASTDDFFKVINYQMELGAVATRQARQEVAEQGLTGTQYAAAVDARKQQIMANPPLAVQKSAERFALYQTFNQELGPSGKMLQDFANQTPGMKLILPIVRTPVNIFKYAGERTPLALATQSFWKDVTGADPVKADLAKSRLALGSMTMGLAAMATYGGYLTGGGPSDPKQRKNLLDLGWKPYSFFVGGKYISINRLEPVGMLLTLSADYTEAVLNSDADTALQIAGEVAWALTVTTAKNFSSRTFVKGLADTLAFIANPERQSDQRAASFLQSLLPLSALERQVASALDPTMRDAVGVMERINAQIPGKGEDVKPLRTLLDAEPIYMTGVYGPVGISQGKQDPEAYAIAALKVRQPDIPKIVEEGITLTAKERDYWDVQRGTLELGGKTLREAIAAEMARPTWDNLNNEARAKKLEDTIQRYHDRAGELTRKEFPVIDASVRDAQRARNEQRRTGEPMPDSHLLRSLTR